MTNNNIKPKEIEYFLHKISELGMGEKTALKRSLGQSFTNANALAVAAFYRALPTSVTQQDEEAYFLAATCICYWKDDKMQSKNLIECLLKLSKDTESIDKRFIALLDTEWNQYDDYFVVKISRLIRIIKQKNMKINFADFLNDLVYWNKSNRPVQRRWAKAYFGDKEKY